MSHHAHKKTGLKVVNCRVLTVSDTRSPDTDKSGKLIAQRLQGEGHIIIAHTIVADEKVEIKEALLAGINDDKTDSIIITGGTGVAPRDVTIEVVDGLLTKHLPGFGEIFRMLSFEEIGPAAIASRSTAGMARQTLIFATPGSTGAVTLAMDRLILPEMGHLLGQARRKN